MFTPYELITRIQQECNVLQQTANLCMKQLNLSSDNMLLYYKDWQVYFIDTCFWMKVNYTSNGSMDIILGCNYDTAHQSIIIYTDSILKILNSPLPPMFIPQDKSFLLNQEKWKKELEYIIKKEDWNNY